MGDHFVGTKDLLFVPFFGQLTLQHQILQLAPWIASPPRGELAADAGAAESGAEPRVWGLALGSGYGVLNRR